MWERALFGSLWTLRANVIAVALVQLPAEFVHLLVHLQVLVPGEPLVADPIREWVGTGQPGLCQVDYLCVGVYRINKDYYYYLRKK